jgi:hypothetical protein
MARKYSHQGYQDNDRKERDDRGPRGPQQPRPKLSMEERVQKKSLRHATDPSANEVIRCHQCGRNIHQFGTITEKSTCPSCHAPLHCCRACRSFDVQARWQCRTDIEEAVSDKAKANGCDRFEPRIVLDSTGRRSGTPQGSGGPREAFDSLFKR